MHIPHRIVQVRIKVTDFYQFLQFDQQNNIVVILYVTCTIPLR